MQAAAVNALLEINNNKALLKKVAAPHEHIMKKKRCFAERIKNFADRIQKDALFRHASQNSLKALGKGTIQSFLQSLS